MWNHLNEVFSKTQRKLMKRSVSAAATVSPFSTTGVIGISAAFDNVESMAAVVADLKEADLGVPINPTRARQLLETLRKKC